MAQLNYVNSITLNTEAPDIVGNNTASIEVSAEVKLFTEKYSHVENEEITNGDDIGFTIVFGNYGELPWTQPDGNIATLEDTIQIASPIRLKVMSLSLACDYQIWVVARDGVNLSNPTQLNVCDVLTSGEYTIQLRKLVNGEYTEFFDIPCHFIECISMLFQVEFDSCPSCSDECIGVPINNGDFEEEPHNTENIITDWDVELPQSGDPFAKTVGTVTLDRTIYDPMSGEYFALIKTDGADSYTSISQSIEVCSGDTIEGYAFFYTVESEPHWNDNAKIQIFDQNDNLIALPYYRDVVNGGTTDWEKWSYTFINSGIYKIKAGVANFGDSIFDSYMGIDIVQIV